MTVKEMIAELQRVQEAWEEEGMTGSPDVWVRNTELAIEEREVDTYPTAVLNGQEDWDDIVHRGVLTIEGNLV